MNAYPTNHDSGNHDSDSNGRDASSNGSGGNGSAKHGSAGNRPLSDIESSQEQLVAYLDGELDADSARHVEQRLADDEQYRVRLQELERAWDLLDSLPRTQVDETFTRTTVEMVALEAEAEARTQALAAVQRRNWGMAIFGGSLLASAVIGYFTMAGLISWQREQQIASTDPVQVTVAPPDSADKQLDKQKEFRDWLNSLSVEDRKEMVALIASDAGQEPHEASPREEADFDRWLKNLPKSEQAKITVLPLEQRQQKYRESRQRNEWQRFQRLSNARLSPEDGKVVFEWLDGYSARHEQEATALLPEDSREHLKNFENPAHRQRYIMFSLLRRNLKPPVPDAAELAALRAKLSPETQRLLDAAENPQAKLALVQTWVQAAVFAQMSPNNLPRRGPPVSNNELDRFYREDLNPQQRKVVDDAPTDKHYDELRTLYYQIKGKRWGGPGQRGDGQRGDGPGPRGEGRGDGPPPREGPPHRGEGPGPRSDGPRSDGPRGEGPRGDGPRGEGRDRDGGPSRGDRPRPPRDDRPGGPGIGPPPKPLP